MNVLIQHPTFLLLAYAGLLINILMELAKLNKADGNVRLKDYLSEQKYNLIASVIMIPVLLIVAGDTSLKEILPLNYVTAVLCGWQTDATFKALMALGTSRLRKKNE